MLKCHNVGNHMSRLICLVHIQHILDIRADTVNDNIYNFEETCVRFAQRKHVK